MQMVEQPELLTIEDAFEQLVEWGVRGLTLRKVRRWAAEGFLPFFKMGKRLYIEKRELWASLRRKQDEALRKRRA